MVVRFVRNKPLAQNSQLAAAEAPKSTPPNSSLSSASSLKTAMATGFIAAVSHAFYASQVSIINGQLNLGVDSVLILISCILVSLYILGSVLMPIKRLGILVFPITLICLLSASLWSSASTAICLSGKTN